VEDIVIPVLVTGIQPAANVTVQGEMDPGNECRDDEVDGPLAASLCQAGR
jgi:hypothetical protein